MPHLEIVPALESTPYETVLYANPVVVVSDVIRATTTATTAVARGNRCIPVATVEAARAAAAAHNGTALLVGEQGGEPIPGFDLNNSPAAVDRVEGKTIILLDLRDTCAARRARRVGRVRGVTPHRDRDRKRPRCDRPRRGLPCRLHARRVP